MTNIFLQLNVFNGFFASFLISVLYCSDEKSQKGDVDAESVEALKEQLQGLKEQLAFSQTELKELREQMRLGVLSVEPGLGDTVEEEGPSREVQQLRSRVTELEEELAQRCGDSDMVKQLTEKVEELQAALAGKHENGGEGDDAEAVKFLRGRVAELEAALAEFRNSGKEGGAAASADQIRRLQERVAELEGQLRTCVPRSELEEVQVTLGLQCEQLARERAEVARRLNDALLDLERLRPPQAGGEEEEEEEEQSVSSEPSLPGEQYSLFISTLTTFQRQCLG